MHKSTIRIAGLTLALALGCSATAPQPQPTGGTIAKMPTAPQAPQNPLLATWSGPNAGVPPFDKVKVEHFKPALQAGMDETRRQLAAIADEKSPPTFDNTIAPFERSGRTLDNVQTVYAVWLTTMSDSAFQAVEREMAPVLAAFGDEITQNEKLFRRIEAVYQSPTKATLTPEQQRLVWRHYTNFVRQGAKLNEAEKKQVAAINQRLATLYTSFSQNVLKDEEKYFVALEKETDLAGLPESVRTAAAAAAKARSLEGKWAINNTRSAVEPFLTYSTRRELREKVWRSFVKRGDNGDGQDNNKLIAEILALRDGRARILGYPSYAHWHLEDSMAKTPARALELMQAVWPAAVGRVREEVADMQAVAKREGAKIKIEPWDYRFYAEKVRKAKYDLDQNEVKPYLQLEKLREGMFWVAGELFGFSFTPVTDVPVYHPDVRVWEVKDRTTGRHVGRWYFDPYARPGKRSGAWMLPYRSQERLSGEIPTLVSNNANFMKTGGNEPVLISWEDARTLFHEFGHALHGLSSNVTYPSLAGTSVARDFVEFPSQLLEHWLSTPEVLNRFALHYETQKPIPEALVAKIAKAARFNQGFITVEYLASALVDMQLHLEASKKIDPARFEPALLKKIGMPAEIVMRHRTPQFSHLFANEGYAAGYYSYLWSDTLTADAYEAFKEKGGPYDHEVAARLRKHVFSVGNTVDPADAYRAFRGRDATIDALMRKRGFPLTKGK